MKAIGPRLFVEIVSVDFEFSAPPGERPTLVCLVARERVSGRVYRLFEDELSILQHPPYPIGPEVLIVTFYGSAEANCHLALGWPAPANHLDLFAEFRTMTNGLRLPCGSGLLGALMYFGLSTIGAAEKQDMRKLAMRGGPYTDEERRQLIEYCESDVIALERLLDVMLPKLDIERALLRGQYMIAAASIEHAGIPIDVSALTTLRERWKDIQDRTIAKIDTRYHVFDGRTFKADRFERYLIENSIPWPRLDSGRLALDDDTFQTQALVYPAKIAPLRDLRNSLSKMRLHDLAVGSDGRNRCMLSAFRARTGRNQPSNSKFIFGSPIWLRSLIRAEPGHAVAYIDWAQQEFGIAAALSGDPAMIDAYASGDPYLEFAKQAGAVPLDATRKSHEDIREQYKTCALGTLYNMGKVTLANRTGLYIPYAEDLLRRHRETYPQFWRWSDNVLSHAMLHGHLHTVFGWNLFVEDEPNPNSLRNFPMQANGAEMLRLAIVLAIARGVKVIAPVHDAILIEAKEGDLVGAVVEARRAMRDASRIVLSNLELRTDVKIFRHPLRYVDMKRGAPMWRTVWSIIREEKRSL